MVYVDGNYKGTTPLSLDRIKLGEHVVRVSKFGREDWIRNVHVRSGRMRISARLRTKPTGTLVVTCKPDAAVFIDGQYVGETPITASRLNLGAHEVRLTKEHFTPLDATVELTTPKRLEVHYTLSSETEAMYLAAIRRSPDELFNYIELAHYYVLAHRFDKAMDVFRQAFPHAREQWIGPNDSFDHPVHRLYDEIRRIHERQYQYGNEEDVRKARKLVDKLLEEQIKRCPDDYLARYSLADAYVREGRKPEALRELTAAESTCDNGYTSKRITRLLRTLRGW